MFLLPHGPSGFVPRQKKRRREGRRKGGREGGREGKRVRRREAHSGRENQPTKEK
jgi:hypothetical protein